MRPAFRTGRSAGHTILHRDGNLFYRAPSVEAAELLCKALNALAEKGITFPDLLDNPKRENPPEFRALVDDLKGDASSTYPNNGLLHEKEFSEADLCMAQKAAYRDAVERVLYNLLDRGLLRIDPKNIPVTRPTDEDIEEASVGLLKDIMKKGNFMDGLSALVNLIRMWKRKGQLRFIVDNFDIQRITAPVDCPTCEGDGMIGPEPCRHCGETGQQDPNMKVVRERLESYNKRYETQ